MIIYTRHPLRRYYWKGVNRSGQRLSGRLLALNEQEVNERLTEQSIQIIKLKKRPVSLFTQLTQSVTKKDITLFTRQMSTMLATGLPICHALKLIQNNHPKAEMKSILRHIIKGVEAGSPIAKTLANASPLFDSLYVDLIATGEQSGNLAQVFTRIADYREKSQLLNAKVIKALIYPSIVVMAAALVSYLMLNFVIPQFETMFHGFGAQLPWFTQQVLTLSAYTQTYAGQSIAAIAIVVITLGLIRRKSHPAALLLSRLAIKLPVVGEIIAKASIARFSRTLATSVNAGVPILAGLKASAKTAHNLYYQTAIESVLVGISAGTPFYIAMRNGQAFPDMVVQMVMVGEESGHLDEMLNKIADLYEVEVDTTVDNLGKILEPAIIIFLGLMVGGLVVAMYLPIFNLMSVLG
ncbi:type II secretion system protein F [Vibrio galatheae]|uniref:Type II secretion system protein F n=1 Tax=Vibrio galatheae TaxID=579748 RepID=A0A0F4NKF9_9VIBR|nr:type II secretion system F family protein [Vibrio galatheae]KJY83617.1 type II secretion system protein F [Vibrio galatheae]